IDGSETLTIKMTAYDFFGYSSVDTVLVEIRDSAEASALPLVLSIISLIGIVFISKKRK
ncbi:MAG: hypothetical protein GOP50_11535, partial [Candidatus Heimdallarchaeota archaeon]|nr:hypothetical protein [Candidatus Heimdallarchaeota archaeon]